MPDSNLSQTQLLTRWRLVLGEDAERHGLCIAGDDEEAQRIDALVGFLFEPGAAGGSAE